MISVTRLQAWTMWALASLFYAYQYVLRVLPNVMMPQIMEKFQIDACLFGQYSGIYYLGYAGMHLPLGLLFDRFGPRYVMTISIGMTLLGLLPLLYTDLWIYPILGRALMGMGSAGATLGLFKVIRMGFPEENFTRLLGISVTIGLLGAIYGGRPVHYLRALYGWETVVQLILIAGAILACAAFLWIPGFTKSDAPKDSVWEEVKGVITNGKLILVCVLGGFMVGPLEGFADVWGAEYLKKTYRLSDEMSSFLPSLIFLGMCFGSPFLSYIADRTRRYYRLIVMAGFLMLGSFLLILSGWMTVPILMGLFSVIGVMCAYQIPLIYKASSYADEKSVGLATAGANMIIMTFGYFFHSIIGRSINLFWDGACVDGKPVYTPESFTYGLAAIPLGLLIGSLGLLIVSRMERQEKQPLKLTIS